MMKLRRFVTGLALALTVWVAPAIVKAEGESEGAADVVPDAAESENFSTETETAEEPVAPAAEEEEAAPAAASPSAEETGDGEETEKKVEDDGLGPDTEDDDLSEFDPSPEVDLENKIGTLLELLDQKGQGVDDKTKEQLEQLKTSLKSLGLDTEKLFNGGKGGDAADGTYSAADEAMAKSLMNACATMAAGHFGLNRPGTFNSLKNIKKASNVTAIVEDEGVDAATQDMLAMIVACAEELTQEELTKFDKGRLKKMPKNVIEAAAGEFANATRVWQFDAQLFRKLKLQIGTLVEALETSSASAKAQAKVMPSWLAMLTIAAFLGAMMFLGYKFVDVMRESKADASTVNEKRQQKKAEAAARKPKVA